MNINNIVKRFSSIFNTQKNKAVTLIVPEEPETESEKAFSKALQHDDFDLIVSFVNNEYELTKKQKNLILQSILEIVSTKILDNKTISENDKKYYYSSNYSPSITTDRAITPKEFIYLSITYQKNLIDDLFTEQLLSKKYIKFIDIVLSKKNEGSTLSFSPNKKDILNSLSRFYSAYYKDDIEKNEKELISLNLPDKNTDSNHRKFESLKSNIKSSKDKLIELENNTYFSSKIQFESKHDVFFPTLEDLKVKPSISSPYNSNKNGRQFYTYTSELSGITIPFENDQLKIYSSTIQEYLINTLIRKAINDKKVDNLAQLALSNEAPMTFAYLVNLSNKHESIEKYQSNPQEMLQLIELCKTAEENSYKGFKTQYEAISNTAKVLHKDLSDINEVILEERRKKQESLDLSIELMKKEKQLKKRSLMTVEELLDESSINYSIKRKFKDILNISKEISILPGINLEEKQFCLSIDKTVLNLIQLQFSFTDSIEDSQKYHKSLMEQSDHMLNTLHSIREQQAQKTLDSIQEQMSHLLAHQNSRKNLSTP